MAQNLAQCQILVRKASKLGARALFLPEASDYIASNAEASRSICRSIHESDFVIGLQEEAKKHSLPISVGIHEPASAKKVKNTLVWIDETGTITQKYHKLHLFDVDIKDGPRLKESDSVEQGEAILDPFSSDIGKIGQQICFDLRFPEPALALRARGAQVLVYPSAFTVPTGKAGHWDVLLRARAIETQSYVIASAQVGKHDEEGKRRSYGHSMIVDPWGKTLVEMCGDEGGDIEAEIAVAEIDLEYLEKVRREVPLIRRTDVYSRLT